MNDPQLCTAIIGLLLGALLSSPFFVYWMRERDRRKSSNRRRRRPRGK